MGTFSRDFALGAQGVEMARKLLFDTVGTAGVADVQADPYWGRCGVDLLWHRSDGRVIAVEVKYEARASANVVLESISNDTRRSPGWWLTSHAHFILYGFAETGGWFGLELPGLRGVVRGDAWRGLRSVRANTRGAYSTYCRLLPIREALGTGYAARLAGEVPPALYAKAPSIRPAPRGGWRPAPHSCDLRTCSTCGGAQRLAA